MSQHAKSFRWAAALLPSRSFSSVTRLYAFCRYVDDVADRSQNQVGAKEELKGLRDALQSQGAVRSLDGWAGDFLQLSQQESIPRAFARDLVDGAISDLGEVRVASEAELILYCYRVAGAVGLMMCPLIGVRNPRAMAHAVALGIAMQLTNIARDVLEDARIGRVYLPESWLRLEGSSSQALLAHVRAFEANAQSPLRAEVERAVQNVTQKLLNKADDYYRIADSGMAFIPLRFRFAILAASRIYQAIGTQLRRTGTQPLRGRVFVRGIEKALLTIRGFGAALLASFKKPTPAPLTGFSSLQGLPHLKRLFEPALPNESSRPLPL